jgi:hypothetical protein
VAKRISDSDRALVARVGVALARGEGVARAELATATRTACHLLEQRHPGHTVELRVPPFSAVQLGIGNRGAHTRGTPPNVVETDPTTLVCLATGSLTWPEARAAHRVSASGAQADLSECFPL